MERMAASDLFRPEAVEANTHKTRLALPARTPMRLSRRAWTLLGSLLVVTAGLTSMLFMFTPRGALKGEIVVFDRGPELTHLPQTSSSAIDQPLIFNESHRVMDVRFALDSTRAQQLRYGQAISIAIASDATAPVRAYIASIVLPDVDTVGKTTDQVFITAQLASYRAELHDGQSVFVQIPDVANADPGSRRDGDIRS
jgi:hypothetical protein